MKEERQRKRGTLDTDGSNPSCDHCSTSQADRLTWLLSSQPVNRCNHGERARGTRNNVIERDAKGTDRRGTNEGGETAYQALIRGSGLDGFRDETEFEPVLPVLSASRPLRYIEGEVRSHNWRCSLSCWAHCVLVGKADVESPSRVVESPTIDSFLELA